MGYSSIELSYIFLILFASGYVVVNTIIAPDVVIAEEEQLDSRIVMKDQGAFVDSDGMLNIVGVVDNNGIVPVSVMVGLNVTKETTPSNAVAVHYSNITLIEPLYAKVIYPGTGAPFRIKVEPESQVLTQPFVKDIKEILVPSYGDVLALNYTNMAVGSEKALVGTIKNNAPFEITNIYIYASVHDSNRTQIDSAKSPAIPSIQPGEEVQFEVRPDPAIKSGVFYYSCAGIDFDAPITTLTTGDGGFIPFTLEGLAKITNIRYENASDSIIFGVDHYNPAGDIITLKLPQMNQNEKPSVLLDELAYNGDDVKIISDGKTLYIDIFVPPEEHEVQIKGISYMT